MDAAFDNFVELKTLIVQMLPKHRPKNATPEEYLQRVTALPNPPNFKRIHSDGASQPPTPAEAEIERKRQLARRAAAGVNAGMIVHYRKTNPT